MSTPGSESQDFVSLESGPPNSGRDSSQYASAQGANLVYVRESTNFSFHLATKSRVRWSENVKAHDAISGEEKGGLL